MASMSMAIDRKPFQSMGRHNLISLGQEVSLGEPEALVAMPPGRRPDCP